MMRILGIVLMVVGMLGLLGSIRNMKDDPPFESLVGAIAPGMSLILIGSFCVFRKLALTPTRVRR